MGMVQQTNFSLVRIQSGLLDSSHDRIFAIENNIVLCYSVKAEIHILRSIHDEHGTL